MLSRALVIVSSLAALVLGSQPVLARGDFVGNGGDAIICTIAGVETVTFYDTYAAEALFGLTPAYGPGSYTDKILFALKRLERLSPRRAALYRDQALAFFSDAAQVTKDLVEIDDSDASILGDEHCRMKQAVIQRTPQFPLEKRYTVDMRLFNAMSEDDKATLILHEIIYREAIAYGATDSRASRYFLAIIFSHALDSMTAQAFHELLLQAQFDRFEFAGHVFQLYASDGACTDANFKVNYTRPLDPNYYYWDNDDYVGILACGEILEVFGHRLQQDKKYNYWFRRVRLEPNGQKLSIMLSDDVPTTIKGYDVTFRRQLYWHEGGTVVSMGDVVMPFALAMRGGKVLRCDGYDGLTMTFDKDGFAELPDYSLCRVEAERP